MLCTATNTTPHEHLFNFPRRSSNGQSTPTWLSNPGPVLLKRHARHSKYDPLVDEVELLEANPKYAHIRHSNGRESTVSLRDLAPCVENINKPQSTSHLTESQIPTKECNEIVPDVHETDPSFTIAPIEIRKSTREHRAPVRLDL